MTKHPKPKFYCVPKRKYRDMTRRLKKVEERVRRKVKVTKIGLSITEFLIVMGIILLLLAIIIPDFVRGKEAIQAEKAGISIEQLREGVVKQEPLWR